MRALLRGVALAIATVAAIDPSLELRRGQPVAVDVRVGQGSLDDATALEARDRLAALVMSPVAGSGARAAATVVVNAAREDLERLPDGMPISFVETRPLARSGLAIVRVEQPPAVLPGQTAVVRVHLQASAPGDAPVAVSLEQDGVTLAAITHSTAGRGERFAVDLPYAPPAAGLHRARVTARFDGMDDAPAPVTADVGLRAEARTLRVLVFEPRPSWAATFVRHALESDPAFEMAALAQSSRGVAVRSGRAPARLTPDALDPFDAVLIGAPETLSEAEVRAIETFVRVRGGSVILQPDRRPSGPYARLLPSQGFDEALLESPIMLAGAGGMRASEFALPRRVRPDAVTLAGIDRPAGPRPVVFAWPLGHGRIMFSGALDAWRYRSDDDAAFARFWTGLIANLAAAAPRALEVSVEPSLIAPGGPIRIQARVRTGETPGSGQLDLPAVTAARVRDDGARTFVRLWPAAEPGTFEGRVEAGTPGRYVVRVTAGSVMAEVPVAVAEGVRQARQMDEALLERVARTTGGLLVDAADLDALAASLEASRTHALERVHPMRSGWWLLAFAGLLCAEWAVRRRRGLR